MFVELSTVFDIEDLKEAPSSDDFEWVEDDDLPLYLWIELRSLNKIMATSFMKVPGGRIYQHSRQRVTNGDGRVWEPQGMVFVPEPSE